jgi:hypothetical protein
LRSSAARPSGKSPKIPERTDRRARRTLGRRRRRRTLSLARSRQTSANRCTMIRNALPNLDSVGGNRAGLRMVRCCNHAATGAGRTRTEQKNNAMENAKNCLDKRDFRQGSTHLGRFDLTYKEGVAGSNPASPTSVRLAHRTKLYCAHKFFRYICCALRHIPNASCDRPESLSSNALPICHRPACRVYFPHRSRFFSP